MTTDKLGKAKPRTAHRQVSLLVFVALALVLGGASNPSSTGPFLVQVLALCFGCWALLRRPASGGRRIELPLAWMVFAWLAIVIVHLLPLPPSWWSQLPGRAEVWALRELLGLETSYLPLSLDPPGTARAFLAVLPLAAVAALVWRSPALAARPLGIVIIAFTLASFSIGAAQILGGPYSPLYFHAITNRGLAVGFFANANHLATLYLISIPVFAALSTTLAFERQVAQRHVSFFILAYVALVAVGIYQTGSVAGAILMLPTTGASLLVFSRWRSGLVVMATAVSGFVGVIGLVAWIAGELPLLQGGFGDENAGRLAVAKIALSASWEFWPIGSGLGTFREVFPMFEDPVRVTSTYRNHVHNDYLEVVFECGAAGVLLIVGVLGWCGCKAFTAWRDPSMGEEAIWRRAASVVVAVLFVHSLVDYPLRTPALMVVFGIFALVLSQALGIAEQGPVVPASRPRLQRR